MSRPRRGLLWAGAGALALVGLWILARLPLPEDSLCLFRRVFFPCPGCGMTRAVAALGRGDFAAAWKLHPLSWILALEAAALWLAGGLLWIARPRPVSGSPVLSRLAASAGVEGWLLGHLAAFVALWVGRVATGALPW